MTSTAIPSSATNDGWGGIRYTVFPSEHQYNPYNIRTPSIIPFIPKPTDPSNTVQA